MVPFVPLETLSERCIIGPEHKIIVLLRPRFPVETKSLFPRPGNSAGRAAQRFQQFSTEGWKPFRSVGTLWRKGSGARKKCLWITGKAILNHKMECYYLHPGTISSGSGWTGSGGGRPMTENVSKAKVQNVPVVIPACCSVCGKKLLNVYPHTLPGIIFATCCSGHKISYRTGDYERKAV